MSSTGETSFFCTARLASDRSSNGSSLAEYFAEGDMANQRISLDAREHLPRRAIGVGMRFSAAFNWPRIATAGSENKRRTETTRSGRKDPAVAGDQSFMG